MEQKDKMTLQEFRKLFEHKYLNGVDVGSNLSKVLPHLTYDELKQLSKESLDYQIVALKTMQLNGNKDFEKELDKFYRFLFKYKKMLDDIEASMKK